MVSLNAMGLGGPSSMRHFKTPLHPAPGNATGEPSDMGSHGRSLAQNWELVKGQPPWVSLRATCQWSLCLVTGEATPLVRPLKPDSPDPMDIGRVMGGIGAELSVYAGGR